MASRSLHVSHRPGSALVAATLLVLAFVEAAVLLEQDPDPWWVPVLLPAMAVVYIAAGQAAWVRRPENRMGALMMLGALSLLVTATAGFPTPLAAAPGVIAATSSLAVVVHLLHAFPSGRTRSAFSRGVVVAGYLVCSVLQAPLYLLDPAGSVDGSLALVDAPEVAATFRGVQIAAGAAVMVATAVVLVVRWRRETPARARVLAPLSLYGVVAVLAIPLIPDVFAPAWGWSSGAVQIVQATVLAVVPVAFTVALLAGGFPRVGELRELSARLASADRERLGAALAETLGDSSVRLVFRLDDTGEFVDAAGLPSPLPGPEASRAWAPVTVHDHTVGAIVYDPGVVGDRRLLHAAAGIVGIAVDRERLTVALRAERRTVRESRTRLAAAAAHERERIARDLHDGLQAQLVLLAVQAQQWALRPGIPEDAAADARLLRTRIDDAAARVRDIVFTVAPPLLVERGLAAAVEDLADRMPVRTGVTAVIAEPLQEPTRSTAYFVIAELLSNAVKHAHAARVDVTLQRHEDMLHVTVRDDGVGGADGDGHGMRGIADRVGALGGTLDVQSVADRGTAVRVELPCGS